MTHRGGKKGAAVLCVCVCVSREKERKKEKKGDIANMQMSADGDVMRRFIFRAGCCLASLPVPVALERRRGAGRCCNTMAR